MKFLICIPLGGTGERFKISNYKVPKPLIQVNGVPILYKLLNNISNTIKNGDFTILIPYNQNLINYNFEEKIQSDFPSLNFDFTILHQKTDGAAQSILSALNKTNYKDLPIICLDGDSFYNIDIIDKWGLDNEIFCIPEFINEGFSYIKTDDSGKISDIQEKNRISNWACTGAYGFQSLNTLKSYCELIIKNNIKSKGEFYTSSVILEMIKNNHIFTPQYLTKTNFISLGTPKDLISYMNMCFLFDLDGTLVNTDDAYVKTWEELLDPYGYTVDKEWFDLNIKGKADSTVFNNLFPDHSYVANAPIFKELSHKKDLIFSKYIDHIIPINGAINFVKQCLSYEIPCSIVTNCNRQSAEEILKKFHIYDPMKSIIIGNECDRPKPFPDPYLKGINTTEAKTYVVFEDTPTGIQSGKSSGVDCVIGIETSYSEYILKTHGAHFTIPDFNYNLFDILQKIEISRAHTIDGCSNLKQLCVEALHNNGFQIDDISFQHELLKGGYIANIYRMFVKGTNLPKTLILKKEASGNHYLNKISRDLKLYEREYLFYEDISHTTPIKVPKYYGTVCDNKGMKLGIILEDLNEGYTFDPVLNADGVQLIIKNMAILHNKYLDNPELLDQYQLRTNIDPLFRPTWEEFCNSRWILFEKKWSHILSTKQLLIGKHIIKNFSKIQYLLSIPPLTLVHGDIKIPNIAMYNNSTENQVPYFLDWQYIVKGKGIQDIAFLLVESFQIDDFEHLLKLYLSYLHTECTYEQLLHEFKIALCYFPFYVAMWFGTMLDDDLIDVDFPKKYVPKLFTIYEKFNISSLDLNS